MVKYGALKGLYEVEKTIGSGGFAKVKLATHLATGEKVAIKIMHKSKLGVDLPRVTIELEALRNFSHKHICKMYQVIDTENYFFIVMEYCSGGELFDHIVEKNRLTEAESQKYFRQIVSAVAYLHSLGYAHRDLKPENVLLDTDQNLKLIDFGLCAKPAGGIETTLDTSCGSPTYAAPELILGKKYLGAEVDVWAMGVLLYALLCGFLPFDDTNVDALYKKILIGHYDIPPFTSEGSRKLIKSMLQVEPKNRITIDELLSHPWLTGDTKENIDFSPEKRFNLDEDCVTLMSQCLNMNFNDLSKQLKEWKYDYETATYFLLLARKNLGRPLKLNPNVLRVPKTDKDPSPRLKLRSANISREIPIIKLEKSDAFSSPAEPRSGIRKPQKRIRSPNLDGEYSPVPTKKVTPAKASVQTPECKRTPLKPKTPGSARGVFGSIERSLHRVRHVLTPRRAPNSHPVILTSKDLCNVSTTQCTNPEFLINELTKALEKKGISCERKGFRLRGNALYRFGGCSFELEMCLLPSFSRFQNDDTPGKQKNGTFFFGTPKNENSQPARVGIRRKRLKGDSWCYKKVCEEVLALTAAGLKQTESVV